MELQTVSIALPKSTVYVTGTVNQERTIWTNTHENFWDAIVPRVTDDVYDIDLTIYNDAGTEFTAAFTLHYSEAPEETVWSPVVSGGSYDPSPAVAGQTVTLKFVIIDVFGVEGPEARYADEFHAGEV